MPELRRYQLPDGRVPVSEWLARLRDKTAAAATRAEDSPVRGREFWRLQAGGQRVLELRVDVGAGYRLYCARRGQILVILTVRGREGFATSRHPTGEDVLV